MEFVKLHALGNDFVVVEARSIHVTTRLEALSRAMCDRHYGVGADGLLVVSDDESTGEATCSMRIFNADGSEAEVSGNGTRCVAAYLAEKGRWPAALDSVYIRTLAGVKVVRRSDVAGQYEMEMGTPRLGSRDVPMDVNPPLDRVVGYPLQLGDLQVDVTATSIGNPHCTVFVDALDDGVLRSIGPRIERHPCFPARTNVELVHVVARDRLRVRFWERGAGETLSSGTGSSAATVAAVLNGLADRAVTVETSAGPLEAEWREADDAIVLRGPAELVYVGDWRGALS